MRGITSFTTGARHLRRAVITSAIVALALAGLSASASAATTPAHASTSGVRVIHIGLALDCAHMSASARHYAIAHHYCTAAGTAAIHPDSTGTEPGDCGTSFITINNLRGGRAQFIWGFSSTLGTVIGRNLAVNWLNELFGNFGGWGDSSVMFSSSYSSPARTVATGEGEVFGDEGGSVLLWWGATCTLLNPSTAQNITS